MNISVMTTSILLLPLLAGCSDSDDYQPEMSIACEERVETAANVGDDEVEYERALTASLNTCTSVDEWIAAAKLYPAVAVASSAAFVDVSFLEIACRSEPNKSTPVCVDGFDTGVLDGEY